MTVADCLAELDAVESIAQVTDVKPLVPELSWLSKVAGRWQYGSKKFAKPTEYRITKVNGGDLRFEAPRPKIGTVSGVLLPHGIWLQSELCSDDDVAVGAIRLRLLEESDTILSNFKPCGKLDWGSDIVASRVPSAAAVIIGPEHGIKKFHRFIHAPQEVARIINAFAFRNRDRDGVLEKITGGRYEVFLLGVRSEPFQAYARRHRHSELVADFLSELRRKLVELATSSGGVLSEDIVALVGGDEMQVPHVDLKPGQVQVIVALSKTTPTLVFDPAASRPTMQETMDAIGVGIECAKHGHLQPLMTGGSPLVLPVEELYKNMVWACDEFDAGDAVQIPYGIVHAGPQSKNVDGMQRVVVFSTYTTLQMNHYDVSVQYKMWDWATCEKVPARVAYSRLREVYDFAKRCGMLIEPWTHYGEGRLEACRKLCISSELDEATVEALVRMWRSI